MMIPDPATANIARLMFEMYAEPSTSFEDIARYFAENNILIYGKELKRGFISPLLRNTIYAQAGLELYEFFKGQGAVVVNDAADFAGTNGCYLYQGRDVQERKNKDLRGQILVLAPSEGIVSADTWLRCRKLLLANITFQGRRKARNTWLAGKIKCGRCGHALMSVGNPAGTQYLRCSKRADNKSCEGPGTLTRHELEKSAYNEMVKKMREFQTLTGNKAEGYNPKLTAARAKLAKIETEIEKLIDTLTATIPLLLQYANNRIEELEAERKKQLKLVAGLTANSVSSSQIDNKTEVNKVYDPACGSGSLLLQAAKILGKENVRLGFWGQEINLTTYNLCRINMFLHDIDYDKFDIAHKDTLTNP